MKCSKHNTVHPDNIYDSFLSQCKKHKVVLKDDDCAIEAILENENGVTPIAPEYNLFNKSPTEVKNWPSNIDLMITRFPDDSDSKGVVGYIANQAYQHMNSNALVYIMASAFKEEKNKPFQIVEIFINAGFIFIDTIIWVKNKFIPTQGAKRLNNIYDFVFMFGKGDNYHLNRSSVASLKNKLDSETNDSGSEDYICPGNVWKIKINDKDATPVELIDSIIKLSNLLPNSTIIDPFMDTGTVLKCALSFDHSFWGCEPDALKFKKCKKILLNKK